MAMTHDELCLRAARFLQSNGFGVAFHDRFRAYSGTGELPDAIGFRNGTSCLIEVMLAATFWLIRKNISVSTLLSAWVTGGSLCVSRG